MNVFDFLLHTLNFIAPAMWTALLLVLVGRLVFRQALSRDGWWLQWAVTFLAGLTALLGALWVTSHDGRMLGYGGLVLASAGALWALARRRRA